MHLQCLIRSASRLGIAAESVYRGLIGKSSDQKISSEWGDFTDFQANFGLILHCCHLGDTQCFSTIQRSEGVMYSWSDSKLNEHLKSRQISQAGEHETMDKVLHNAGNSKILHNFLEIVTVAVAEPGCDMKLQ